MLSWWWNHVGVWSPWEEVRGWSREWKEWPYLVSSSMDSSPSSLRGTTFLWRGVIMDLQKVGLLRCWIGWWFCLVLISRLCLCFLRLLLLQSCTYTARQITLRLQRNLERTMLACPSMMMGKSRRLFELWVWCWSEICLLWNLSVMDASGDEVFS